ncbi:MAG: phosphoribosylanthranilate isomerase [Rhodobacterales bacterium]|nr:MAG: phosphoribosylanthranilate isomerase [Rhodobacterales bacterium]
MAAEVKICGLRDAAMIEVAHAAGARWIGFVFFPKSPRHVTVAEAAKLARAAPSGLGRVALVVNASDAELDRITGEVPLDLLQLHGGESPERVAEIRARFGVPVMKAIGVAQASDLAAIDAYAPVADRLLIDAKAPKGAALPGGNGLSFDWRLLVGRKMPEGWMLAGGLAPGNVVEAIRRTGAPCVDVSSGVERAPGIKDAEAIRAFCAAARTGFTAPPINAKRNL